MKKRNGRLRIWVFVFAAMMITMTLVPVIPGLQSSIYEYDQNGSQTEEIGIVDVEYNLKGSNNVLSYTMNGFEAQELFIDGEVHYSFTIPQEAVSSEKGYPELPMIARSIIIPDDQMMEITVTNTDYIEYTSVSIPPSKGYLCRTEHPNPSLIPYEFGDVYNVDSFYPENIASLREPYILRDFRGQVVEIYPFQYNPVRNLLRVHTEITVEIKPVGVGDINIFHRTEPITTIQRDFARIYERQFVNYDDVIQGLRYDPVEEEGNMLVISPPVFAELMDPLVDWKNNRGLPTELVTTDETGTTTASISNYIEDYYHDEGLTYVLLVGNEDYIPTPIAFNHASDPSYSFIVGSDLYPDIFVGRFSAANAAHVETQVERSIYYEQNTGEEWRTKAMGIASDEGSNPPDWLHMRRIRNQLYESELVEYTWVDEFYDGSQGEDDAPGNPTSTMVSNAFNDGRHLANYVGHGYYQSVSTSGFNTNHINALTNTNKLSFFITVACLTGAWTSVAECFGEAWSRATHDGQPTGGIGAFCASRSQLWVPPMTAQNEMMDVYTGSYENNVKITSGGVVFNGVMRMNDVHGSTGERETAAWHLFGDPSIVLTGDVIPPGDPPEIEIIRPNGGEIFTGNTVEDITWSAIPGDDPVDHIDLFYSVDAGESWETIDTGLANTGSYTWTVPNVHSSECLVRIIARDVVGRFSDDTSVGYFTIEGIPPGPPQNLEVEQGSIDELIKNGMFHNDYEPWNLIRIENDGEAVWDGENYQEGGSIHVSAHAEGSGNIKTEDSYWEQSIYPISREITLSGAYRRRVVTGSGFGWTTRVHHAAVEIMVHDTVSGWQTIFIDEDTSNGDTGWNEFAPAVYDPVGEVNRLRVVMHVESEGDTGPVGGTHTAIAELWVDHISVLKDVEHDMEDNILTWDASPDDPLEVSHYNVYRSESFGGTYELIGAVDADGSTQYGYVDFYKGTGDDIAWWYMVRAVGANGLEEENDDVSQEPGADIPTFEMVLSSGGAANGWNFVSFNLIPGDTSLESILGDIAGTYDRVLYYDSSSVRWYSYVPGRPAHFNSLQNWDHTMGIWIRMTVGATLTVEGNTPSSTSITLEPGWNMVGLPSSTTGNHGLPTEITCVGHFHAAEETNLRYVHDTNSFEFEPGQGYWLFNSHSQAIIWTISY